MKYLIIYFFIFLISLCFCGCPFEKKDSPINLWRVIEKDEKYKANIEVYGEIYFDSLKFFTYNQDVLAGNIIVIEQEASDFWTEFKKIREVEEQIKFIEEFLRNYWGMPDKAGHTITLTPIGNFSYSSGSISKDLNQFEQDANCRYSEYYNRECIPIEMFRFTIPDIDSSIERKEYFEPGY